MPWEAAEVTAARLAAETRWRGAERDRNSHYFAVTQVSGREKAYGASHTINGPHPVATTQRAVRTARATACQIRVTPSCLHESFVSDRVCTKFCDKGASGSRLPAIIAHPSRHDHLSLRRVRARSGEPLADARISACAPHGPAVIRTPRAGVEGAGRRQPRRSCESRLGRRRGNG
jgi:hypothetical protein